jgi:hypothetical protein
MVVQVDEQQLAGGVANAGQVTRSGGHVLRPCGPYSASVRDFLLSLRAAGFEGAPLPAGMAGDGRERFVFIEGDVAVPPYPGWAQSDAALASVAVLLGRFHQAARSFDPSRAAWSSELADPVGGPIICHNDVCLENVVFRDGTATALLDFDFAAPGRPIYDLAQFARLCVPIDDEVSRRGSAGTPPTSRPGSGSPRTPTAWTPPRGGNSWWSWPTRSRAAAPSSAAASKPGTRTSSACGTRWAAWSGSTAAATGGRRSGRASSQRSGNTPNAPLAGGRGALGLGRMGQAFTSTRVASFGKISDSGADRRRCKNPKPDRIRNRPAAQKATMAEIRMIWPICHHP